MNIRTRLIDQSAFLRFTVRIMRLLSANRLSTETGVDKYQPQPLALGFANGAPPSEVIENL